jgi:C4-dicarboxylate-specific signal transduction histidine kinase
VAASIERSAESAMAFVRAIREQARNEGPARRARFRVADRVAAITALLSYRLRHARCRFDAAGVEADAELVGDPGRFDQILGNLLGNALDACADRPDVTIRVQTARHADRLIVAVDDDGPGVPAAIGDRIFEPLFTTRGDDGGTGLGLAIARDLARSVFGADLRLVRRDGPGARFELSCPA